MINIDNSEHYPLVQGQDWARDCTRPAGSIKSISKVIKSQMFSKMLCSSPKTNNFPSKTPDLHLNVLNIVRKFSQLII